jgi:NAD(P)-dependent dehydrogenase (short-subunit alcohol dehydrogenase family)
MRQYFTILHGRPATMRLPLPPWALTNAIRTELRATGTLVVGVHAGWIDTDMAADVPEAKISVGDVAAQTVDAVEHGDEEVLTDDSTRQVKASLPTDQSSLYPAMQQRWDANDWAWKS